jgi:hypothetical protein
VRQRVFDTYCEDGYCERYVRQRVFRQDRRDQRRYRERLQDDD